MIQVIGTKKCKITQKALRFFRERSVEVQFLDVTVRPLAPAEVDNCARALGGVSALLDKTGAHWRDRGMDYLDCNEREELLADMSLLLTPLIRNGKTACIGNDEAAWKKLVEGQKA